MRQKPKTKSSLFYYWSCSHAAQDKRRAARVPKTAPHGPLSLKAWGVHLDCHILSWSQFLSTSTNLYQVLWCLCPIHPYSSLFYSILEFLPPNSWSFAGIIQLSIEVNPFFFPISWCSITPKPSAFHKCHPQLQNSWLWTFTSSNKKLHIAMIFTSL